ncbi:hypothetical protein [Tateyamaria pelophila]
MTFAIRKSAVALFTFEHCVASGIPAAQAAKTLRDDVTRRANNRLAGGTSTGKTTLTNALQAEVAKTSDRAVRKRWTCSRPGALVIRAGRVRHRRAALARTTDPGDRP